MNELEQQLAKIVEKALKLAEQTGQFVIDQAPDLLQEFYRWHTLKYSMGILLGIMFILLAIFLPRLWTKKVDKDYRLNADETIFFGRVGNEFVWLPFMVFTLSGTVMLLINLYYLIFVLSAPKLYLIETLIK